MNALGAAKNYGCASNERSYAGHIWDRRDAAGQMGATAGIVVPGFAEPVQGPRGLEAARLVGARPPALQLDGVLPTRWAFNLQWHEKPLKMIFSHVPEARGYLTKPGMEGHDADHRAEWESILP